MVKVPEYVPQVSTRPIFQSELSASGATPDAFGAGVGRGMQALAQGVGDVGAAVAQVQALEDVARAKEADNAYSDWARERMYGDGGFMTLEGRSAVDGRGAFEQEATAKRREFGKGLTPGAAKAYDTASSARMRGLFEQSIIHSASERKTWFKEASGARVETFANDALVNFANPDLVLKSLAAGQAEIRQQGALNGWDADTLKQHEADFISGVQKNITLRIAQTDPIAASEYAKKNAKFLTGAHQYELEGALQGAVLEEQSKREADAIIQGGRKLADVPGDIVAEVAAAADPGAGKMGGGNGGKSIAGRPIGGEGPTRTMAFLASRTPGKGPEAVSELDASFATNLAAMIQDAPPEIRAGLQLMSGYRSIKRQKELFAASDGSGKWVARPGHSQHNFGRAVDLMYNGVKLSKAPREVRDWVHANAKKYGMFFPMSWEPWHIEPIGSRSGRGDTVAARSDSVAVRASMPTFDDIESKLDGIADPKLRDLTRKRLYATMEMQSKSQEQQEKAAKAELWRYVDQGATPDQVPLEVRQAAGMSSVSSAWEYVEKSAKREEAVSDETLLYDMRRYAATNPTEFADVDLNDYRDRLSKDAIKELTGLQTGALTDVRKAKDEGLKLTEAFSQSQSQLEAVGITTTGKTGTDREEAAKRIAEFQNSLAMQMDEFKRANQGRPPTQLDIQSMVNRLLLPVVVKTPGTLWGTNDAPGFAFEAGSRPDDSTIGPATNYGDIPVDLRRGIALDLELALGRKPTEEEIIARYQDFILDRPSGPKGDRLPFSYREPSPDRFGR